MSGAPPPAKKPKRSGIIYAKSGFGKKLIIILENCVLEFAKIGKKDAILTSEDGQFIKRQLKQDPLKYRPDILHQCLLMLLDSPLNRSGLLQIYFHTSSNVLVEVSPQCRIPRTFNRFCGLMLQLLVKRVIKTEDGTTLMKVIKNPVTQYLPVGCEVYLTSFSAEKFLRPREVVPNGELKQVAVIIGCIATGQVKVDYPNTQIKISNYPLSAAITCSKFASEFEEAWDIL
uniref:Ribosomal RNA small subunit methyltransferase NEP1 n=1 Tax=Panagrolaimus sp. JU765 TaxID=591449 RepID=A0AC34QHH7_9BILA